MQEDKIVKRIPTNLVTKTIITSSAEYEPNKEYTDEDANIYEKYLQAITNVSIDINGDIEKIKALEDNILEQYNKNVELANKMKQETEKFARQANTAIEDYNSNAEEKTNTFNSNVETKTTEFNNNSNAKTEEFNNNSTEKINAFNSNAEEKIAEYDAHAESVLTETEDLFNALDTEKASGTELYIEDAKPCRVINTGVNGMYKQETTSGTNLMNLNVAQSSKVTVNEDGTITINGTGGFGLVFESFTFKANIPYYIKWEIVSGNIPTNLSLVFLSSINSKWLTKDIFNTITPTEDKESSSLWIYQNAKFENAKIRIWISKSKSDFEPYTGRKSITKSGLSTRN